jgi:hypothetical protein
MENMLPKEFRKPVPKFTRKWLEAARLEARMKDPGDWEFVGRPALPPRTENLDPA